MPVAAELELPSFDHTNPELRGERYRAAMSTLNGHDGWLAASPFGYIVLDRESGEFFLRTKAAVFPGLIIADLFGITDGPLREEIVRNIININGGITAGCATWSTPRCRRARATATGRPCGGSSSNCSTTCRPTAAASIYGVERLPLRRERCHEQSVHPDV